MSERVRKICFLGAIFSFVIGVVQTVWFWKLYPQTDMGVYFYLGIQELFLIGIPALLLSMRRKNLLQSLLIKPDTLSTGLVILAAVSFSLAAVLIIGIWILFLQSLGINVPFQSSLPKADSVSELIVVILMAAIIPAVSEELMFRGLLQTILNSRFKQTTANVLCALAFSLLHFSIQGFAALFVIGLFLSSLMNRSHSLWLTIIFHAVYNSVVLLLQTLDSSPSVQLIFLCMGIYLAVCYLLFHKREVNVWN